MSYGGGRGICKERKARRNSAAKRSVTRSVPAFRSVTQARQNWRKRKREAIRLLFSVSALSKRRSLAERTGFEPAVPFSTRPFQDRTIDLSDTSPSIPHFSRVLTYYIIFFWKNQEIFSYFLFYFVFCANILLKRKRGDQIGKECLYQLGGWSSLGRQNNLLHSLSGYHLGGISHREGSLRRQHSAADRRDIVDFPGLCRVLDRRSCHNDYFPQTDFNLVEKQHPGRCCFFITKKFSPKQKEFVIIY